MISIIKHLTEQTTFGTIYAALDFPGWADLRSDGAIVADAEDALLVEGGRFDGVRVATREQVMRARRLWRRCPIALSSGEALDAAMAVAS